MNMSSLLVQLILYLYKNNCLYTKINDEKLFKKNQPIQLKTLNLCMNYVINSVTEREENIENLSAKIMCILELCPLISCEQPKNGVSQKACTRHKGFPTSELERRERRKRRNAHYQTGQKGVRAEEHALFTARRSQQVPGIVRRAWPAALFCTTPL